MKYNEPISLNLDACEQSWTSDSGNGNLRSSAATDTDAGIQACRKLPPALKKATEYGSQLCGVSSVLGRRQQQGMKNEKGVKYLRTFATRADDHELVWIKVTLSLLLHILAMIAVFA